VSPLADLVGGDEDVQVQHVPQEVDRVVDQPRAAGDHHGLLGRAAQRPYADYQQHQVEGAHFAGQVFGYDRVRCTG
jgi:hypothetical protein